MEEVRAIEFDENGIPQPVLRTPLPPSRLTKLLASAMSQLYKPVANKDGYVSEDEERFRGLTNAEVGAIRQAEAYARGDNEAAKFIFDRMIGKAKQQVESLNVTATLQDYLQELAKRDAEFTKDVVDAEDVQDKTEYEYLEDKELIVGKPERVKIPKNEFSQLEGI